MKDKLTALEKYIEVYHLVGTDPIDFDSLFQKVYIPTGVHHLHGVLEPASRKVRTTFTETEPMQI